MKWTLHSGIIMAKSDEFLVSHTIEKLLQAALERNNSSLKTGRHVVTFRDEAIDDGIKSIEANGFSRSVISR